MPYDRPLSKRNRYVFAKIAPPRSRHRPRNPSSALERLARKTAVEGPMTLSADVTRILAGSCAALAAASLIRGWAGLRDTTLVGAWVWALGSIVAVATAEISTASEPLKFAAAALTLCPAVAVLGAKRPQDRAWHWIVLSLWVVVCVP